MTDPTLLPQAVADFLQIHPRWQRTPSAGDLQALVLPQLASGSRLGIGAFGCVYQPRAAWHFPRSGIAVKAVPLDSKEAASGAALEAELLTRVVPDLGCEPSGVRPDLGCDRIWDANHLECDRIWDATGSGMRTF